MIGTTVASYRITHKLAEGGMGVVYVAVHEMMDREAVVKVLLPEMSVRTDMVKRFFNEARAAASIQHPGIVDVFDLGYADDGSAYIVMEKLRGETLAARLAHVAMSPEKAAQVVRQLASALAAAHGRGIIHRDLKPDNIFLVPDPEVKGGERVKVLDFGIAKLALQKRGSLVTAAGAVFGTPAYMAPEQCSDAATVDQRADIYALGCILYECLTARPPFGHGGLELLAAHLRDKPEPPSVHNSAVGEDLDAITLQLLEKDPENRFQNCTALADVLRPHAGTLPGGFPSRQQTAASNVGHAATVASSAPASGAPASSAPASSAPASGAPASSTPASGAPGVGSRAELSHASQSHVEPTPAPPAQPPITTHTAGSGQLQAMVDDEDDWLPPKQKRPAMWIAIGLLLAAGVAGAVAVVASQGGGSEQSAGTQQIVADAGTVDATPESPAPVGRHLDDAQLKFAAREWTDAMVAAKQALAVPGILAKDQKRGEEIATKAEGELINGITFDGLVRADKAKDVLNVVRLFRELPEDSVYRQQAEPIHTRVRDEWVAPRKKTSEYYASRGRPCATIDGYAKQARTTFPTQAEQFEQLAKSCRSKAVALAKKPRPKPATKPKPAPKPPPVVPKPAPKPTPKPSQAARKFASQARVAYRSGNMAKTLSLVTKAWKLAPGNATVAMLGAMSSCSLKKKAQAKLWLGRVKRKNRKAMAQQICLRAGINLAK